MLDRCLNDELSSPTTISDLNYYVAVTGKHIIPNPTFTQAIENCSIKWSLVAIDSDTGLDVELSTKQE